jgi:hypothetical protein
MGLRAAAALSGLPGRNEFGCESMLFLLRILIFAGLLAGLGYGALHALATLVEPEQREISVPVDPPRPRATP